MFFNSYFPYARIHSLIFLCLTVSGMCVSGWREPKWNWVWRQRLRWLFIHWMHKSDTMQEKRINRSHRMHTACGIRFHWRKHFSPILFHQFFCSLVSVHCVTIASSLWKFSSPVVLIQCFFFHVYIYFVHVFAAKRKKKSPESISFTKYAAQPKTTFTRFSHRKIIKTHKWKLNKN